MRISSTSAPENEASPVNLRDSGWENTAMHPPTRGSSEVAYRVSNLQSRKFRPPLVSVGKYEYLQPLSLSMIPQNAAVELLDQFTEPRRPTISVGWSHPFEHKDGR
ncbi:auxin response factor 8 [Striga asiatica]|uniref:Auxin response factor 8 n=1 Tax=Striga asiatica TaxID=4170 RepID=A0A5A7Q608_STRAF|nr:auxin response factor 8 [Striga asiatica]